MWCLSPNNLSDWDYSMLYVWTYILINKKGKYWFVKPQFLFLCFRVLFPGGATWFNQSDGYADAGRHIFDIAKEMNDNGQYMPLWGTCLGFELLLYLDSNGENRAHCSSSKQPLPLEFKQGKKLIFLENEIVNEGEFS